MAYFKKAGDIKVGVIGYGGAFNMGREHLGMMSKAGMTPLAVAEIDPERLEVAKDDYADIETYTSVNDMLDNSAVDLVAIITPHNTHAELALQCLRAGRHVVCEKPLAITTAECDVILQASCENNAVASTFHNRHWDGCILQAVKTIREQGLIGEVYRIDAHMGGYGKPRDWWRSSKTISGGIMYDWGVHLLEYSLQIMDGELTEVCGFAKNGFWADQLPWKEDSNEDEGFAVARFDNGKWITLKMSSLECNPKQGSVEFYGVKGCYIMSGKDYESRYVDENGDMVTHKASNPEGEQWRYYQNVADHLVKDEPLVITTEWARRPIQILDMANRSARQGHSLRVSDD